MQAFGKVAVCVLASIDMAAGQDLKLPDGPGKVTTEKVCGSCHGADIIIGRQETREIWGAIVDDMVQRGAQGTPEEFYEVVDYLSKYFSKDGPVTKLNANKLSAKEFSKVLRVPEAQAVAIVKARDEKGGFKSVEEIAQLPGVDSAKVLAGKNRLAF